MRKTLRKLQLLVVAVVATVCMTLFGAAPALAADNAEVHITSVNADDIRGYVSCSTEDVVGIHIDTIGGPDGWAAWSYDGGNHRVARFSYNTQGYSWFASVGCGGSPANWKNNIRSNTTNRHGTVTVTCSDIGYNKVCVAS